MTFAGTRAGWAHIIGRIETRTAAEELISSSLAAQAGLVGRGSMALIPAVAESPIPVLAPRNRTPDPLARDRRRRARSK